jgi:hypothetical protein
MLVLSLGLLVFRLPALGPFRFYVGGGASVLFVRDAKITNPVLTQVATPKLEVTPALGAVGQLGVDIHLFDRFSARLDIKELWFQPSQATISNIRVPTTIPLLETVDVGTATSVLQANLGPTMCHHFYFPYSRKLWGREPEELSGIQARKRVTAGSFTKLLKRLV